MADQIRILHAPTNVGNNPYSLSRAERELGFVSDVVDFIPAPTFRSQVDEIHDLAGRHVAVHAAVRSAFLGRAVRSYDVFHFNFGQALVPVRVAGRVFTELGLLKRLGKKVIVTWQGCDVRPMECCNCSREDCAAANRWRLPNAQAMLRHADRAFYLNPDLGEYLPGAQFLPYAAIDVARVEPAPAPERDEVVIAHLPTDREVKGTDHVVAAVERLRAEGLPVELDLVENVPHEQALERIRDADLVVDQLIIGWYGAVAVEAMALGRPVVCHIDPDVDPFGARLPVVRADRDSLVDELRRLVQDRSRRVALGAEARAFVLAEHDPRVLARRVLEGLVPIPSPGA